MPYFLDTIHKKIRPHFISWLIWSIVSIVAFLGQWVKGGGAGSWSTGMTGLIAIIITLFAFKNGTRNVTKFEKLLFGGALVAIMLWIVVKDPILSVIVAIIVDASAFYLTIRKTIKEPTSETSTLFVANLVRGTLAIIALQHYNITTVIYPVYQLISNLIIIFVMIKPRLVMKHKKF